MAEEVTGTPEGAEVPEVVVEERKGISVVWLIPVIAVVIGGWMVYHHFATQGPEITVTFKTASGLEAGKTKIKFRAVEVGLVEAVTVSTDLSHVVVHARMDKDAARHLRQQTQFWVVRPRIGAEGISGLGTIVSGAYIGINPGGGGPRARAFTGLEEPPVLDADVPGRKFILRSKVLGSVGVGTPVYFRKIKVGEAIGYELAPDNTHVTIHVFIGEPHHVLVRDTTTFWNASGIEVSVGADGMNVRTESLEALLSGGIAFETPAGGAAGTPSPEGATFLLYDDYASIAATIGGGTARLPYVLYFEGELGGLEVGAPVKFRGLTVGEVTDIRMEYDPQTTTMRLPVVIAIEPQRVKTVGGGGESPDDAKHAVAALVEHGMRAQLQTGSLLTGQLFVEMALHPGTPVRLVGATSAYPELPTIPSFTTTVSKFIDNLQNLPVDKLFNNALQTLEGLNRLANAPALLATVRSADATMKDVHQLAGTLAGRVPPLVSSLENTSDKAGAAMGQAQQALTGVASVTAPGSPVLYDLATSLKELAGAARSIRILANYLERNPDALVFGKGRPRKR